MAFSNNRSITLAGQPQSISRTQTPGNLQKFTISAWIKRRSLGDNQCVVCFGNNGTAGTNFVFLTFGNSFGTSNMLFARIDVGGSTIGFLGGTNSVITDTTTWHHVMLSVDTTQAVAANRARLYVDGVEVVYTTPEFPPQNSNVLFSGAATWYWGRLSYTGSAVGLAHVDALLDELHYVDGRQLVPSDLASGTPGFPRDLIGGYGAQGSRLRFEDNSSTIALGTDSSGNALNWNLNNLTTASSTTDALLLFGVPDAAPFSTSSPVFGAPSVSQRSVLAGITLAPGQPALGLPIFRQRQIIVGSSLATGSPEFSFPDSRVFKFASLGLGWNILNAQLKGPFQAPDTTQTAIGVLDSLTGSGPFRIWRMITADKPEVYMFEIDLLWAGRYAELGIWNGTQTKKAWAVFDPRTGNVVYEASLGGFRLVATRNEDIHLGFKRLTIAATVEPGPVGAYLQLNNSDLISAYPGDGFSGVIVTNPKFILANEDIREFDQMIGPPEMRFYWTVHVGSVALRWFRASSGQAGVDHHLEFGRALDLECVLQRWKPAHTEIVFDYSGLQSGTGDRFAGTP